MKCLKIILVVLILLIAVGIRPAHATLYSFSPSPTDLWDLDHYYYYTWGINWTIPTNEQIVSATIRIPKINDWTNESGDVLYMHLFDTMAVGAQSYWDNQNGGDSLWAVPGGNIYLTQYTDNDGNYGESNYGSFTYNLTAAQLASLNSFLVNGNFGLGFDPDCHYYNEGIKFKITTRAVPEPASLLLISSGLLGCLGFGRRKLS